MTFPPLPQPKLVHNSATPEGCKAELIYVLYVLHASIGEAAAATAAATSKMMNET